MILYANKVIRHEKKQFHNIYHLWNDYFLISYFQGTSLSTKCDLTVYVNSFFYLLKFFRIVVFQSKILSISLRIFLQLYY